MAAEELAIEVTGLQKSFGRVHALRGVDLTVPRGQVTGFLGPNGAGKSTTIRILLGLLRADGGEAKVLGGDPWADAVRLHRSIAYVPGDVNLWPNLTGGEVLDVLIRLSGPLDVSRKQMMLDRFDLDPTKRTRTYSKGNRQKVAIVAAFASDVELFILDEPTVGLDPLMESVFQDYVREASRAGRTVLLSSHVLAEVEALCDRVSIIREGRTVESGTLAQLRHLTRTPIAVETKRPITGLAELAGVHELSVDGAHARFEVDPGALDGVLRHVTGFGVRALTSAPPTLEELFMRHYGAEPGSRGGAAAQAGAR